MRKFIKNIFIFLTSLSFIVCLSGFTFTEGMSKTMVEKGKRVAELEQALHEHKNEPDVYDETLRELDDYFIDESGCWNDKYNWIFITNISTGEETQKVVWFGYDDDYNRKACVVAEYNYQKERFTYATPINCVYYE